MTRRYWHSLELARIVVSGAVLLLALSLASCASHENRVLTDACVKAGGGTDSASLSSRCECAASAAEKYLDPEDYKLLVGVAEIYNENISADEKLQKLIVGIANEGVTPAKASVAAMDMMFLAHKVANECAVSGLRMSDSLHRSRLWSD